jgi:hypothetical protein
MLTFQYIYISIFTEIGTDGERKLLFVRCKRKTERANFLCFYGKGKWKFVFLGRHTLNGNRHLLFQQTCPSMYFTMKKHASLGQKFDKMCFFKIIDR